MTGARTLPRGVDVPATRDVHERTEDARPHAAGQRGDGSAEGRGSAGPVSVLDSWRINARVTAFLVERLPDRVWPLSLPGAPRRTVRSVAVHLHNCRCLWLKSLGKGSGVATPGRVGRAEASQAEVLAALALSGDAVHRLLRAGLENGGTLPGVRSPFVFGAMPRDAVLFCAYALAHEAHHRGQLVAAARALGHRLAPAAVAGLWQWSSRLREVDATPVPGAASGDEIAAADRGRSRGVRSSPPRPAR